MVGQTLSRYRIVEALGAGAMGEVYRAEDARLQRPVALKLVTLAGDTTGASQRLLSEARAASALNHPNIAVVYEVDEVEHDGVRVGFIAMEYIAGHTLAALSAAAPLTLDTILEIGRQIADALASAHARGLVHRDIKPSNVMVTDAGLVKVLDFGLARWSPAAIDVNAPTRTADPFAWAPGISGTLPYMSPEQATGRPLDGRSDMFSLGVLLYELLSGRRPFEGANTAQVFQALLQNDPPPLNTRFHDARIPAVEAVVRRMLAKDPAARYADLAEVAVALAAAQQGKAAEGDQSAVPVLAVADFANISGNADDDWLGTGMSETITADLRRLERVSVVSRGRVYELARTLAQQTGEPADMLWIRVGRELGARWMVTGSFQRAGEAVRVTASLLDIASAIAARTVKVDGTLHGIFALQDRLVRELASGLRSVTRPASVADAPQETGIVGAYEAFSKGVVNLRTETYESLDRAVLFFERAVALDPNYARAHLELGVAYATKADYSRMKELGARAVVSLKRALELQPTSARAWRELGSVLVVMGRDAEGLEAVKRALEYDPHDPRVLGAMARTLFIGWARFDEAASWYERALAEDPNAGWYALQLSHCAALLRDFTRGEAAARRAIELQEAFLSGREGVLIVGASMRLGHLKALQRRYAEAVDDFLHEIDFLARVDHALRSRIIVELNMRLGCAYLAQGQTRKGLALLDVAIEAFDRRVRLGAEDPFTRYYASAAYAQKGDADTAIAFLERSAADRRAFTVARARIEPEFEAIRTDPRFQRLVSESSQQEQH